MHLIHRRCNCKPGTSRLSLDKGHGFTQSYTLARLQQSAPGCRSRTGITHGCGYSQMLSTKHWEDKQSTDALRESQPSHLRYYHHNRQLFGRLPCNWKDYYLVIGFITCNPQASGVYPQKRAQMQSLGPPGLKKEPLQ